MTGHYARECIDAPLEPLTMAGPRGLRLAAMMVLWDFRRHSSVSCCVLARQRGELPGAFLRLLCLILEMLIQYDITYT